MNAEKTRKEKLFDQFPVVSTAEWEAQIRKDLKGADYRSKLIWETPEGFQVKPYYRAEDLNHLEYLTSLPGEFPYTRGNKIHDNKWIAEEINNMDSDPIGNLLATGDFYISKKKDFDEVASRLTTLRGQHPPVKTILIGGNKFQNAGSTLVQELAFGLVWGNEYLVELSDRGFPVEEITAYMKFIFALGPCFFLEIAKLRAARILWANIVELYHPGNMEAGKMDIHGITAEWNKTLYDPYVNLLRTTSEGISGALGGADSIQIRSFLTPYRQQEEFGERMSANQHLIFQNESYLDKVIDPAAGSYFVENLTDSMATHAWNLFKEVEEKGGLIECIQSGFIQETVYRSRQEKEKEAAQRKRIILGTNQFPNPGETISGKLTTSPERESGKESTYKKLKPFRIAEPFENLRLATEQYSNAGNDQPAVFLFSIGNSTDKLTRAGFAANFFGCAGYRIIESNEITDVDSGVTQALFSGAKVIVICSSDNELPEIVPEIARKLQHQKHPLRIVIAAYPDDKLKELAKAKGINEFIHRRSNLLETLQGYHHFFGIQL